MDLISFFKKVLEKLKREKVKFALTGGFIASAYRTTKRTTEDLDFLILAESNTQEIADKIIKEFGLTPHIIRKSDLERKPGFTKKTTPVYMILGKDKENKKPGLDFILPPMPWFEDAINRAQFNNIDFGIAKVPSLTLEDFIISKIYAVYNDSSRFKDMDDLKSIFEAKHDIDEAYISGQMQKLKITIHPNLKNFVPKALRLASKKINK